MKRFYKKFAHEAIYAAENVAPNLEPPEDIAVVEFVTKSISVMENEGRVKIGIRRYGNTDQKIIFKQVISFIAYFR